MTTNFSLENIKILDFDPLTLPEKRWGKHHEYRKTLHSQRQPDLPVSTSDEAVEKGLKLYAKHPEVLGLMFTIMDRSTHKQVGFIQCVIPRQGTETYNESKEYMEFYINILEDYHRKGIGTKALTKIYEVAEENEKTLLATDTYYISGKTFLQKIGADLEIGTENRLNLEELDWKMVQQWVKDRREESPSTKLISLDHISDEYIQQFSKLYTETYNQQPVDVVEDVSLTFTPEFFEHRRLTYKEIGMRNLIIITLEENGDISGLTEMECNPGNIAMITQGLTGVRAEHRGRGLGKWLKAAMLLEVREQFPDIKTVRTENVTTNAPMLSINNRLGFKFYRESIEGQITLDKLKQYLQSKEII